MSFAGSFYFLLQLQKTVNFGPTVVSSKMIKAGNIVHTRRKFAGITIAAKIPKALIGMIGLNTFARKATQVVLDVTNMALAALRTVYAILFYFVFNALFSVPSGARSSMKVSLWRQASIKTKKSSAAIPSTMKMTRLFRLL